MRKPAPLLIIAAIIVAAIAFDRINASLTDDEQISSSQTCSSSDTSTKDLTYVIIPQSLPSQIKQYQGFTVSFNKQNHTPNYSSWTLTTENTDGPYARTNKFWKDTSIQGCPDKSDYTHSGYDRGHLCPAGDQKWDKQAMTDCFSMANMCPQAGGLNSGAWNTLEQKCRTWAKRDNKLIIVAGPIYYPSDKKTIGETNIRVPSAFFKVILDPQKPKAIGFIYPNMTSPGNMKNYATSVDNVEKETGFDFFSALPDNIENKIEQSFDFNLWNQNSYHKNF